MKPRTKRKIEDEIRMRKVFLAELVDNSIEAEKRGAKDVKEVEKRLRRLRAEPCFEDTFEGKVEKFEKVAFAMIEAILADLSGTTGKDYLERMSLEELLGVEKYTS